MCRAVSSASVKCSTNGTGYPGFLVTICLLLYNETAEREGGEDRKGRLRGEERKGRRWGRESLSVRKRAGERTFLELPVQDQPRTSCKGGRCGWSLWQSKSTSRAIKQMSSAQTRSYSHLQVHRPGPIVTFGVSPLSDIRSHTRPHLLKILFTPDKASMITTLSMHFFGGGLVFVKTIATRSSLQRHPNQLLLGNTRPPSGTTVGIHVVQTSTLWVGCI